MAEADELKAHIISIGADHHATFAALSAAKQDVINLQGRIAELNFTNANRHYQATAMSHSERTIRLLEEAQEQLIRIREDLANLITAL